MKVGADDFIVATEADAADLSGLPREELQPGPTPAVAGELAAAIYGVMTFKGKVFEKHRQVAALVHGELRRLGQFCRTRDGRGFFFMEAERRLYNLEQRPFEHLLTALSGLASTEAAFNFVHDILVAITMRDAPEVEVHTLARYDPAAGTLAVSDGGPGVWVRERGGEWRQTHNGVGGLLFFTEPEAVPWVPDFAAGQEPLRRYLQGFLFTDGPEPGLSAADQQVLVLTWILHQLFPALRQTRAVPAFLGPHGAGKTSAMRRVGRLLIGPGFEVTNLREEKEDGFIAAVTNRTVLGLDNADTRVKWLEDDLATYATGVAYRLRRYFTTNEEVAYLPRAVLAIASRDPHFNRPDVAERLLPLRFRRPDNYVDERTLFEELDRDRPAVMGAILTHAAQVADTLAVNRAPAMPFRMADFAAFGWAVFKAKGHEGEWTALLHRLERAQAVFTSEGDSLAEVLSLVLDDRGGSIDDISISELYKACADVAQRERLPFSRSAAGFGRRISLHRRMLELDLGVRITEERRHDRVRYLTIRPEAT